MGFAPASNRVSSEPKIESVLPSTRTETLAPRAEGTSSAASATSAARAMVILRTNPPSARGSECRRAAGLLTRGALPRRLPGPWASGSSARERLPSQRRDRPGLAPGSLSARLLLSRLVCPSVQAAVRRWGPVVAWAAVIFAFSSVPSLGTGLDLGFRAAEDRPRHGVRDPRRPAFPCATPSGLGDRDRDWLRGLGRVPPIIRGGPPGVAPRRRDRLGRSRGRSGAGLEVVA